MFLQPDWFEVLKLGVGTNRFSYSFNDPVNMSDPNGNFAALGAVIGGIVGGVATFALDLADGRINAPASQYLGAIVGGAITGATGGLAGGAVRGLLTAGALGGGGGELARQIAAGESISVLEIAGGAAIGGVLSGPGTYIARRLTGYAGSLTPRQKGNLGEVITEARYAAMGILSTGKRPVLTGTKIATGRQDARAILDHNMSFLGLGRVRPQLSFGVESKFGSSALSTNQGLAFQNTEQFAISRVTAGDVGGLAALPALSLGVTIGGSIVAGQRPRITLIEPNFGP